MVDSVVNSMVNSVVNSFVGSENPDRVTINFQSIY